MAHSTYTETTEYYWVDTISDPTGPTDTEMGQAKNLTCGMEDFPDLSIKTSTVDDQNLCSAFIGKLPDTISVDDTEFSLKWDDASSGSLSAWARTNLPRNTEGFIVRTDAVAGTIAPVTTAGTIVDVWPVKITHNTKNSPAFGEIKKVTIGVSITSEPDEDVAVV